jgi:hypothetical protein
MHGPPLVAWLLVVLSAAAAGFCVLRREAHDEALTGAGMAVMAVPLSVFDPRPWGTPVFAGVYALVALRALLPARHRGHQLHHSVCSAAMVYMAVAMAGAGPAHPEHAAHPSAGTPLLTGLLLLYFTAYVLRTGMRLVAVPTDRPLISGATGTVALRHAPEVAVACRVSMALGMLAMLLLAL